jgi:molecular chaperone DnaK (HSP70)
MAMQRIREAAEKAKIELSSSQSATINLPYGLISPENASKSHYPLESGQDMA